MIRGRQLPGGLTAGTDLCLPLALKVFYRNLLVFKKTWKANIMFNFVEPVLYLWAMGFGLGVYVSRINGLPYIDFLAPALIASSSMFSTTYEMTYDSFTRMAYKKTFHGMVATPVSLDDVVAGELLYGTFKGVLYGTVFLAVVAMFGLVKSPWALLVPLPLALMAMAFSILSMIWTSIAPNYDSFGYFFTLIITPMFLFSGVFFPVENLPPGVRLIPWFTPLYHAVEVIRSLVLGQVTRSLLADLAWLAIFILLTVRIPMVTVRKRLVQ
ncbi:MAG: ABC transporter permease [Peptococcaceae bacterium]|nr:ABC transporter permease [Peptococcaceae bacterium]